MRIARLFPYFLGSSALLLFMGIFTIAPAYVAQAVSKTTSVPATQDTEITALTKQIALYEAEIKKAGADKVTLKNAIYTLLLKRKEVETQISLTQHNINLTQSQIQKLNAQITRIGNEIETDQAALAEDMRNLQEADSQPFVVRLLSSNNFSSLWSNADAVLEVQNAVKKQADALTAQQNALTETKTLANQKKDVLASQQRTLLSQKNRLTQTKEAKARLLAETNARESTYQRLLARARTELASFSSFTKNAGGSGLLTNQTKCDAWGCYYNQRDAAWGNDSLDGTKYTMKSDGCLVTAMAMVMTHYGYRNVTPVTINSNPANFAAYYPAYLLLTIHVNGVSATRKEAYIDSTLATGNPVIVGVRAYGGTHYVVLVSGRHGHYVMKDPYIPNGDDVSFSSHYSMREIFGVRRVVIKKA